MDPRMKQNNDIMDYQARQSAVSGLKKMVDEAAVCHLVTNEHTHEPCNSAAPSKKKTKVTVLYVLYQLYVLCTGWSTLLGPPCVY